MIIQEMTLCKEIADILISLSTDWEKEDSCHGYRANSLSDLEGRRIFLATDEGRFWDTCLAGWKRPPKPIPS